MRRQVVFFAAVASCSCPSAPPLTLEVFCSQYADLVCYRLAECNGAPREAWCTLLQKERLCSEVSTSERVGNTKYHPEFAQACLDIVQNTPCRELVANNGSGDLDVVCSETLEGLVQPGNACSADRECVRDDHCDRAASRCPGTCRRLRDATEACDELSGILCATGLACVNGFCGLALTADAGCEESRDCESGLFCDPFAMPKSCAPLRSDGPCFQGETDCAPKAACTVDAGCAVAKQQGEACVVGQRECNVLLSCVDGFCQTWGNLGDPCGALSAGENADCLVGGCLLASGEKTGVCVQFDAGSPCDTDVQCGRGGQCLGTPRVCLARCAPL